jgi:hypothetical protein
LQAETGAGILTVGLVLGATASQGAAATFIPRSPNRPFVMAGGLFLPKMKRAPAGDFKKSTDRFR